MKNDQLYDSLRKKISRANSDHRLKKTRERSILRSNFGEFVIWNWRMNGPVETHVDLSDLATRLEYEEQHPTRG